MRKLKENKAGGGRKTPEGIEVSGIYRHSINIKQNATPSQRNADPHTCMGENIYLKKRKFKQFK